MTQNVLHMHKVVVNTKDLKAEARNSTSFRDYSKKAAQQAKTHSLPVLYVNGPCNIPQIKRLIQDRLALIVVLVPETQTELVDGVPTQVEETISNKVVEFGQILKGAPWYLTLDKIRIFRMGGGAVRKDGALDFPVASREAIQKVNQWLGSEAGRRIAALPGRIVPEGAKDELYNSGVGVVDLEATMEQARATVPSQQPVKNVHGHAVKPLAVGVVRGREDFLREQAKTLGTLAMEVAPEAAQAIIEDEERKILSGVDDATQEQVIAHNQTTESKSED